MKPVLFEVLGIKAASYAVFMGLGFVFALVTLMCLVPRDRSRVGGLNRPQVRDLFLVMVVAALLGSKVGHVLFEAPGHVASDGRPIESVAQLLADDPWHWLRLTDPGYVWYGGMLACLVAAMVYFRRRPHLRAWLYADAFAPAVMVGAAIGRVGCFFAGCCFGIPTGVPWGVLFPGHATLVHPTQVYDAILAAGTALFLGFRFSRRRFDGENIAFLLVAYPFFRFLTEMFRGDLERGSWGPFSTSQWISIPLLMVGVIVYFSRRRDGELTSPV